MKVYISGRISGDPAYKEKFLKAEATLKGWGDTVINPARLPEGLTPASYMRISVAAVEAADFLVLLPGWEQSKGARIEKLYAEYIGLHTYELLQDGSMRNAE